MFPGRAKIENIPDHPLYLPVMNCEVIIDSVLIECYGLAPATSSGEQRIGIRKFIIDSDSCGAYIRQAGGPPIEISRTDPITDGGSGFYSSFAKLGNGSIRSFRDRKLSTLDELSMVTRIESDIWYGNTPASIRPETDIIYVSPLSYHIPHFE